MEEQGRRRWLWILAVVPLLPCLGLGFLGDDFVAVDLLSRRGWAEVVHHLGPRGYPFVRPLGWFVFQIERLATGGNAVLIHLIHLGFFTLAAGLTGRVAVKLGGRSVGCWTAALALLYPARIETFAWIAGLFDLLSLILVLASLLVVLAPPARGRSGLVAALSFLSPFAKETGFVIPLVVGAWTAAGLTGAADRRRRFADVVASTIGAIGALIYRLLVMGTIGGYDSTNLANALRGLLRLPGVLLHAIFMPVNLNVCPAACVVAGATAAAAMLCLVVAWRADRVGRRLIAAGGILATLGIVPVLPYISQSAVWSHSRYLTLFGAGLALASSAALRSTSRLSRIVPVLLAAVWASAVVLNLMPWLQAARCRDVILSGIEQATRRPGMHRVWIEGPINEIDGAKILGGNLEYAVRATLPDREIATSSAFLQRLQGERVGPPPAIGAYLHVFRFQPDGPVLELLSVAAPDSSLPGSRQ